MDKIRKNVWITRTQPKAKTTAMRLRKLGFSPLIAPVLRATPTNIAIDTNDYEAVIFTSAHAITAFAASTPRRDMSVYCVGDASLRNAYRLGFEHAVSAKGDARALFDLIKANVTTSKRLLYAASLAPAAPLDAWLADVGFNVKTVAFYATSPRKPRLSSKRFSTLDYILLHSGLAAQCVAEFINIVALKRTIKPLTIVCISKAVAEVFSSAYNRRDTACQKGSCDLNIDEMINVIIAKHPTEDSLFEALRDEHNDHDR